MEIIASLPHFGEKITDKQRGNGVFRKSIEGIRILNNLGYGKPQTSMVLNLVCNIDGPITPADHYLMEKQFKLELDSIYGLTFNHLFCVTNMPINRYKDILCATENHSAYIKMLAEVFDPQAAENVVCRSLISVGYDGSVYDCDFNQMLGRKIYQDEPMTIFNLDPEALLKRQIDFGAHCFGCTAGGGSS